MTDRLREHGNLVELVSRALRDEAHILADAPVLLKRLLVEEGWREFVTSRGEESTPPTFAAFVTTPPLKGLGVTLALVKRLLSDDPDALTLYTAAVTGKRGAPRGNGNAAKDYQRSETNRDNVTVCSDDRGNERTYALRRLRKHRPDLHADVLAKKKSAHRAMIEAGFRKEPTVLEQLQRAWTKASTAQRATFRAWIKTQR